MTDDERDPEHAEDGGGRGKQVAASIVTLITLVVIFAVIFPQVADYGEAWDAVTGMPGWAVVGVVLATVALVLVYPLRYQASIPGLGYRPAFSVSQTAFAIGNGLPGGSAIGLAVQFRMLGDHGVRSGPASAALGINSVWNALVLVAMAIVGVVGVVVAGEVDAWVVAEIASLETQHEVHTNIHTPLFTFPPHYRHPSRDFPSKSCWSWAVRTRTPTTSRST